MLKNRWVSSLQREIDLGNQHENDRRSLFWSLVRRPCLKPCASWHCILIQNQIERINDFDESCNY
jgi:hypothetical protein